MSNSLMNRTFSNIKRSGWRTYAVIFMMTVTFTILGLLLTVIYTSQNIATYLIQKPEVIGFIKEGVKEEQILELKKEFESKDYVYGVNYISKEDAMKSFLEDNKDNEEIIGSVSSNPFPAHLNIKANSLGQVPMVAKELGAKTDLIEKVDDSHEFLDTLSKIVFGIQVISLVLLLIFTISTIFVIFLTIGITVYSHKSELIVMKLVGATNWYVRLPYMMQSFIYSLVAVLISSLILGPLLLFKYNDVMKLVLGTLDVSQVDLQIIAAGVIIEMFFAAMLSFVSSYFATRRYIDR